MSDDLGRACRNYVEARYPTEVGAAAAYTATGEPYVKLVVGGIVNEEDPWPPGVQTIQEAVDFWCREFDKFARGRSGKIVWRKHPLIIYDEETRQYQVSSRLALMPLAEEAAA